jgi:hypothetical protein
VAFGFDGGASRGLPSTAIADISCESAMLIDAQPPTTSAITCAVARALCRTHSKSTAERNSLALLLHCTALHGTARHGTARHCYSANGKPNGRFGAADTMADTMARLLDE